MSTLRQGSVHDANMDYTLKHDYIWADRYAVNTATASNSGLTASFSVGQRPLVQVATTTGIGGIRFQATTDAVTIPWMAYDIDNHQPVYIRHLWTTNVRNNTAAALFTTTFQSLTITSQIQTPTIALNVAISTSTKSSVIEFSPTWTPWGKIGFVSSSSALSFQVFPDDTYGLILNTALSNTSGLLLGASNNPIFLLATEIAYTPKMMFGNGSRREARYLAHPLMNMEAGAALDLP